MLADRAETGHLTLQGTRLVLKMASGGSCIINAWPGADRNVGRRVHVIGTLTEDNVLVAHSIALLGPP